jgi:(1->4)-alpha-D-glucan 1-alpha-D-glucosylmutase
VPPERLQSLGQRPLAGEMRHRQAFEIASPGEGYHHLRLFQRGSRQAFATTLLIACPERCHEPAVLAEGGRIWGPAIQLYALRSRRNWGMGDFADLGTLVDLVARAGAGIVGINPLHALFPVRPGEASPYSPSNRMALNVLYIDVETVPDYEESPAVRQLVRSPAFRERLRALREAALVDYPGVAHAKLQVLELLYGHFRERHLARDSERAREFREFQSAGGQALRLHALYEALLEAQLAADPSAWGWPVWPEALRDPDSGAVAAFARENADRVQYYE